MNLNIQIATIAGIVSWLITGCATQDSAGSGPQYGAKTARPYTQADLDYGHKLKIKMDADRTASSDAKVSKAAIEPFHMVGDVYFAGVQNYAVYAIKTSEGVIMIDTAWADTADKVEASLKKLGINLTDIKIILTTENHGDHNGAVAYFKEKSGAKLYVMEGDVDGFEKRANSPTGARPVKVDRTLRDRDQVKLGGKVLTAYHIPGHSSGSTTWYWQETENGHTYNLANVCCWSTPTNVVTDAEFPTPLLRRNFEVLKSLPVDIPTVGPSTVQFDLMGKLARIKAGEKRLDVFIDPQGYRGVAALYAEAFEDKVKKQIKDGPPPPTAPATPGSPAASPAAASSPAPVR